MKLRVFTAFSGYDSQCMALDRLGINYDLVGWSEIDKYAIIAHNAIYPQFKDRNFGDISKINWGNVPDFDLFTYSFPCTDISNAGQQKGLEEGSGTRSGLLWECKKAIELKRPKYLLMENVKALTNKKFLPYLHKWHLFLTKMGYTNFTKILNAKNYGIPQNRERVFMVSIFGDAWYNFPNPFNLDKSLKYYLEEKVDEKYYLKNLNIYCDKDKINIDKFIIDPISCAIRGRYIYSKLDKNNISTIQKIEFGSHVANCLTSVQKDSLIVEPFILTSKRTDYGKKIRKMYEEGKIKESRHNFTKLEPRKDGICNTITTVTKDNILYLLINNKYFRLRYLTEKECFRLMDVSDNDIEKIQKSGISKRQQYKMAGNSIVVNVLYYIFKNLFKDIK